jgi:hypothetical protein
MSKITQYTLTYGTEYINIDGVIGTTVEGISYSLNKVNIDKFTKNATNGTISIIMLNGETLSFKYSELINPATSLPFVSLAAAESSLEGASNLGGMGTTPFSTSIIADAQTQLLNSTSSAFIIIKASADNADKVYVGPNPVTAANGGMEPGDTLAFEISNVGLLYALNASAGDVLNIFGVFKS